MAFCDAVLFSAIQKELVRQQTQIELIASENTVSEEVLKAQGSVLTNKYAEGYPGRRYYNGCDFVDEIERLAIERLKQLFNCGFANVQPHSGSQANQAVFLALLQPGDTFLGLDLACGGHLTHGSPVNLSGKWFRAVGYGVDANTHQIVYDDVLALAREHRPKLLIAGGSAYPRILDFAKMRAIADDVGAYFMVDMAHFAGLVAGGVYPSPLPHAHVVTSTTHKTLRGPRGGIILTNDPDIAKKINSAVFPGLQGGPLMHVIAAKAVAFGEALQPHFKAYATQVIKNARTMGDVLMQRGLSLVSGGTDSHLILVDLTPYGLTGKDATNALEEAHITCNKNSIPADTMGPVITSGIRLGSPACTTRGFQEREFALVAECIADVLEALRDYKQGDNLRKMQSAVKEKVLQLCAQFPIYQNRMEAL